MTSTTKSRPVRRSLAPLAAAALVGVALPVSAGPASAADPGFGGFSASAVAAPVKIEIYEPTIPIPADPQLEVELAYSKVEADSGSSTGRASWLWPGDPVGEGLKTFVEQLGLPPQLGENGYPVQVNSSQPSGEPKQSDEPFPGTVMRTRCSEGTTLAQVGFSPDSKVRDGAEDEGAGGAPAVPDLPGLSAGATRLQQFGKAITGGLTAAQGGSASAAAEDPGAEGTPGLPPQLAALVDVEGYTSSSKNVATGDRVTTTARSALGDVTLLGGLLTLDGIVSSSTSTSDGAKGVATDQVSIGGITIAGQRFGFGPQGFDAAGQHADIPALPGRGPDAALEQLGIKLELPKPVRTHQGDQAGSDVSALRVDIDTGVLRHKLDALPINALVDALPGNPPQLKSAVQALAGLAPRVVVTLGVATTEVDTVEALDLPTDVPAAAAPGAGASGGKTGAGGSGGAGSAGAPPAGSAPSASGPGGAAPAAGELPPNELAGSGLPPLYTIPGAILAGGIALAAVGGTWLRRIGVIALGGAGSCSHGLDSGLPDLRKAP